MTRLTLERLGLALMMGLALARLDGAAAAEAETRVYGDVAIATGFSGDVAIKGYDPVAYFTDGKAVLGSAAHSYKWLGATWYFASDDHRRQFAASPISFAPQYGGLCAESIADNGGVVVNINPESWKIIDGKLYFSAVAHFPDRELDVASAEANWPKARARIEK